MRHCYPVTDVTAPQTLTLIADRVRRLSPSRRDPEQFPIDKSEVEADLRRLATGEHHTAPKSSFPFRLGVGGATPESGLSKGPLWVGSGHRPDCRRRVDSVNPLQLIHGRSLMRWMRVEDVALAVSRVTQAKWPGVRPRCGGRIRWPDRFGRLAG